MKVEIRDIEKLVEFANRIKKADLEELQVTMDGHPVELSKKTIEEWAYTGMHNFSFFEEEVYKIPRLMCKEGETSFGALFSYGEKHE